MKNSHSMPRKTFLVKLGCALLGLFLIPQLVFSQQPAKQRLPLKVRKEPRALAHTPSSRS